jgi:hypothetical protein
MKRFSTGNFPTLHPARRHAAVVFNIVKLFATKGMKALLKTDIVGVMQKIQDRKL